MGRMGSGVIFMKYMLLVFNLVIMIFSQLLIGFGTAVLLKSLTLIELLPFGDQVIDRMPSWVPWQIIFAGLVMSLICVLGFCGAFNETYCALVMYAIILLLVIILQVILGALVYTFGHLISDEVKSLKVDVSDAWPKDVYISAYHHAPEEVYFTHFFDKLRTSEYNFILTAQEKFSCCGFNGKSDYSVYGQKFLLLDKSCCPAEVVKCTPDKAYEDGCLSKLLKNIEEWKPIIQGVAIGFVFLQVIVAVSALCLAKAICNKSVA